jgi:NADH-quinone oxidoreductase subunit G
MDTVTLTIDGRAVTVEKGKTVLQAAIESGISVPYYCYHPGIGIDGSCRVCVVKIEKMPKLQTSCSTICADGMVVHTRTPDVIEARAGVFEFLLINHPLDCPVCDKGGECPLQDFSYTFGPDQSRMDLPRRTFDGEGVKADVDFGPTLMLNRNRCILCTRCVRFMRDVEGDAQINIIDRGYGSEIATFREEGVHSLISGNLMDVCPVGAITTKDYRFKSRPWDNPQAVDTICTLCSKGCNTTAWLKAKPEWAKGARLIRFTPRLNTEVNDYWMCDIGRFDYHWIEGDTRLRQPLVRDSRGTTQEVPWRDLFSKLAESLASTRSSNSNGLRFLLSAHASHEELFLFRRLAAEGNAIAAPGSVDEVPAITMSWRHKTKDQPSRTKFRVPPVDAPNVNGARLHTLISGNVGDEVGEADVTALHRAVESGRVGALYVFDSGPDGSIGDTSWIVEARRRGALRLLIVQGVLLSDLARAADFVLPGASYVEKEASYTNDRGRLQGAARVIPTPGEAMEDWQILIGLAPLLGATFAYAGPAQIRADIAAAHQGQPGFAEIATMTFGRPLSARHWLQASNPSERWKWDFMFQDLPPVKGAVDPQALPLAPGTIRLREVKS